jgi:3-methyladenine DNA glycosylase AlkD
MQELLETLETEFKNNANPAIAQGQKAYLRNQFEFWGLTSTARRELQKPFFVKAYLPLKNELHNLVKTLWLKSQREYQYFAQELAFKYIKQLEKEDIALFEFMVTHKSWWDTVDFIANTLMGAYFKKYPDQREVYVQKWLLSGNIWLQRSAVLFQLKYKQELDKELLASTIIALLPSKEFFINKAIGWVLREYSRTNPAWVLEFVNATELQPLSRREALRLMKV